MMTPSGSRQSELIVSAFNQQNRRLARETTALYVRGRLVDEGLSAHVGNSIIHRLWTEYYDTVLAS